MKYGLEKETIQMHQRSKQWKLTMEAEFELLKQKQSLAEKELELCKIKLKEMTDKSTTENFCSSKELLWKIKTLDKKVNQYLNSRPSTSTIIYPVPTTGGTKELGHNWLEQGKKEFSPLISPLMSQKHNFPASLNDKKYQPLGTHNGKFRVVHINEENCTLFPRMCCISAMPEYENWSLEELHWQDYNIANRAEPEGFSSNRGKPVGFLSNRAEPVRFSPNGVELGAFSFNPTEPKRFSSNQTEPVGFFSNRAEPVGFFSNQTEPVGFFSNQAEPVGFFSNQAEPERFSSNQTEPKGFFSNRADPVGFSSNRAEPVGFFSNQAEPERFSSNQTEPMGFFSNRADPVGFSSNQAEPVGFFSNQTEPVGFFSNQAEPERFSSNQTEPKGFFSNRADPVGFSSNRAEPVGFFSNQAEPERFSSNQTEPMGFFSNRADPVGFSSNQAEPVGFSSNRAEPVGFLSNRAEPVCFSPNGIVIRAISCNPTEPKRFSSNRAEPVGFLSNRAEPVCSSPNGIELRAISFNPTEPKRFSSNRAEPVYFSSNRAEPKRFSSNQAEPVSFLSNQAEPVCLSSNQVKPKPFASNRVEPKHFSSNQAEPVGFFPPGTNLFKFSPHEETDKKLTSWSNETVKTKMMHISAMPVYSKKSAEELRLEDYMLKKPSFLNQKLPVYPSASELLMIPRSLRTAPAPPKLSFNPNQNNMFKTYKASARTMEASTSVDMNSEPADSIDEKQPQLLQNILKALKGIDEKFSSLESRFTSLEGSVSDISSRVSLMDSKFSSVDMFLTMERIGKKWNALEPKLVSLESSTPNNSEASLNDTDCSFLKVEESGESTGTKQKLSAECSGIFSFGIESKKEVTSFKFVYPIETTDELASIDKTDLKHSTEIIKTQVNSPSSTKENASNVQNNLGNESVDSNVGLDQMKISSVNTESENQTEMETLRKDSNQENETEIITAIKTINQDKPFAQSDAEGKSPVLNRSEEKDTKKSSDEEEDDFVFVEQSYSRESVEEEDSRGEFEFPDVTEYLEVASAKKISKRYELGVEAKDVSMLEPCDDDNQQQMSLDMTEVKDPRVLNISTDVSRGEASQQPNYLFNDKQSTMMVFSPSSPTSLRIISRAARQKNRTPVFHLFMDK